jgi:hypothetical protein
MKVSFNKHIFWFQNRNRSWLLFWKIIVIFYIRIQVSICSEYEIVRNFVFISEI